MNFANNVIIRDGSGIFRSKREVIDSKAATLIIFGDEIEDGLTGAVLEYAVKKYKSHRRLSPSINLFTIEEEYWEKKKTQMKKKVLTFKRCK